jgi:circadian clock protein KaiB
MSLMHKITSILKPNDTVSIVTYVFRLYLAGESINSMLALKIMTAFCEKFYHNDYRIDRVDVLLSPDIAWAEGITATPLLVRLAPQPSVRLMGYLNDTEQLTNALNAINE